MIVLPSCSLVDIITQCNQESPIEACGILAGTIHHTNNVVTKNIIRVYPCRNALNSTTRYKISAEEQYRIFIDIENRGLDLIGFYHSHPKGPSTPSTTDKELANYIGYTYLIIMLLPPKVTAWTFKDNRKFMPESLSIVNC